MISTDIHIGELYFFNEDWRHWSAAGPTWTGICQILDVEHVDDNMHAVFWTHIRSRDGLRDEKDTLDCGHILRPATAAERKLWLLQSIH